MFYTAALGGLIMKSQGNDPFDRLEDLDALGAIKAWLAGDFGCGEENILMLAIRRDTDIDLSDSEIKEIFCEAIEDEREPMDVFQELIRADSGSEGMSPSSLKPR
jgi:hypothetical protein